MYICKRHNQCVLCTVGSNITYKAYVKAIKNIKFFVKVECDMVYLKTIYESY
jgi:hypothetical protein